MWSEDLPHGQLAARTLLDEPMVLFRSDAGVAAVEDRCPHRFAPLHRGKVVGDRVQCGYHGLEFDCTGTCVKNPHRPGTIPKRAHIKSWPVVEKHRAIWVWMGDEAPDPTKIPNLGVLDTTSEPYITKRDFLVIKANYRLLIDNLLDLSHASFLHPGLLANMDVANAEVTVTEIDGVVSASLATPNTEMTQLQKLQIPNPPPLVDKWVRITWMVPSYLILESTFCEAGTDPEKRTGHYDCHLLTPETERSTRYHFAAARYNPLTTTAAADAEIREKLTVMRRFAFAEQDGPMIEAQQATMDRARTQSDLDPVLLSCDAAGARYARVLERLLAAERGAAGSE
jgi:vanillate O-demethylase monooxygenase subunit